MSARCTSCGESIIWASTDNGANMPIDATPVDTGNVAVHRDDQGQLHARVLKHGDTTADWEKRGTCHFETCVNADQHRKAKNTSGWGHRG